MCRDLQRKMSAKLTQISHQVSQKLDLNLSTPSKEGDDREKRRMKIMRRELEYAKCIAMLRKIFRMGLISETEYMDARKRIMSKYLVVESSQEAA